MFNAKLDGTTFVSNHMGNLPVIRVSGNRPTLRNNGYNSYSGIGSLTVKGLWNVLPTITENSRGGHVLLIFSDGKQFLAYAESFKGSETFKPY